MAAADLAEPEVTFSGAVVTACLLLVALGLLMLGVSAVPPAHVPWPAIFLPMFRHRSDLAAVGIAAIVLALFCIFIAVLL